MIRWVIWLGIGGLLLWADPGSSLGLAVLYVGWFVLTLFAVGFKVVRWLAGHRSVPKG